MPSLVFHVEADYQEVLRLRQEINRLEKQLDGFDASTSQSEITKTKAALASAAHQFTELTNAAAQAGAQMENSFRGKMKSAANGINDLSSEIIKQKAVIHDIEGVLADLNAAYDKASKKGKLLGGADSYLPQIREAKDRLGEAKGELFNLTQQRTEQQMSLKALSTEYKEFRQAASETGKSVGTLKSNLGKLTTEAEKQKNVVGNVATKIGKAAAGFFAIDKLKDLAGHMINVRGQFQAADTAIQTLLGSKSKADKLMEQVRDYAKISPLEFSDVTAATQMMLGFNIEAEKVPRFLSAIGDVSMGQSSKFNSLTLAFSQMSAAGKLMGQDLNQMINAGFNPLQQMSETTGKSIAELKKEMSDGKISAEMVQQAFIDATSEGGRFYGMSENGSKTIQGQMSMLQDSIDMAFNEMGEKSEGVIMDGIKLATWLVENYEKVGGVILSIAAAYGAYKASVIACDLVEKSRAATAARENTQVEKINARTAAINVEIAKRKELLQVMNDKIAAEDSKVIKDATPSTEKPKSKVDIANDDYEAQKKTLDEMNAQIAEKAALAQQAADAAAKELSDAQADLTLKQQQKQLAIEENDKAQEALNLAQQHKDAADARVNKAKEYLETLKESNEYDGSGQGSDADKQNAELELQAALQEQATAAEELNTAANQANTTSKNLNTASTAENNAATRVATATENADATAKRAHTAATVTNTAGIKANTVNEKLSTAAKVKNTVATKLHAAGTWLATKAEVALTTATNMAKNAFNALKVAIATNPIGFIATTLTTVIGLFMSFSDSEDEATEATKKFGEEAAKTLTNVNTLYSVVNSADKTSQTYKQSIQELTEVCGQYGIQLDKEKDLLQQVNDARNILIDLIKKEGVERQHANNIQQIQEAYENEVNDIRDDIADEIDSGDDATDKAIAGVITQNVQAKIDDLKAAQKKMEEARKAFNTNTDRELSRVKWKEYEKAAQEYNSALDDVSKKAIKAANANGIQTESADEVARHTREYVSRIVDKTNAMQKALTLEEKTYSANQNLIESSSNITEAERIAERQAQASTQSVDQLASSIDALVKDYGMNVLTIKTKFETEGVPQWMAEKYHLNGKTTQSDVDTAKKTSAYYQAELEDMEKKGVKERYYKDANGKWIKKTRKQIAQGAAQSSAAAMMAQDRVNEQKNKTTPPQTTPHHSGGGGKSVADLQAETNKNLADINRKWEEEEKQRKADYAEEVAQIEIDKMDGGTQKKLAQLKHDHEKEKAEITREAEELKEKYIENAKARFEADYKNKGKDFYESQEYKDLNAKSYAEIFTPEENDYFIKKYGDAERKNGEAVDAVYKEEAEALRSYLKEYGSFQQQRLAIAEEYAEKIKEAEKEGKDTFDLQTQRDNELAQVDANMAKHAINDALGQGELGINVTDILTQAIGQARSLVTGKSNLSADQREELQNLINQAEENMVGGMNSIATTVKDLSSAITQISILKTREKAAIQAVVDAQNRYNRAVESGTDAQKKQAKQELADAVENRNQIQSQISGYTATAKGYQNKISNAGNKTVDAINSVTEVISAMQSGSLSGTFDAVVQLTDAFGQLKDKTNENTEKQKENSDAVSDNANAQSSASQETSSAVDAASNALGSIPNVVTGIISAILKLLDTLGTDNGIGEFVSNILQKVGKIIEDLLSSIGSGELFKSLGEGVEAVISGIISGIVNLFSLGKAGHYDIWGSNAERVADRIEDLEEANEDLQKAIEKNTKALEESNGGIESVEAAEKAAKNQEAQNKNLLEIAKTQGAYHGSHHSWNKYWEKQGGLTNSQIIWARQNLEAGNSFNGDIFSLSPEDMQTLLANVSIRERIRNTGEGGYGERVLDKLDEYAAQADAVDEIMDTLKQKLTQTSFDDLRSNFLDTLMDMNADAEDAAEDITKTLTQAMLNAWISDNIEKDIKTFYKDYAEAAENGLTQLEVREYQERWQALIREGIAERDRIAEITGYTGDSDTSQNTSYGSASNITQDQADEIAGRLTALQVQGEVRNTSLASVLTNIQSLVAAQTTHTVIADDIRTLMANSYLELQGIRENTEVVIKPIKAMASRLESWNEKIKSL